MNNNDESQSNISRRDFLRFGAVGAASAALGSLGLPETLFAADKSRKPNIIVILSDDHGYAELGCQGNKDIPTPNIDSIAANGVRFTSGYVSCPVCSPTRAGLMTGRYQQRFGHEFNSGPPEMAAANFGLPRSEATLAERLKTAGYATGIVGKWHLGFKHDVLPMQRGFDEFYGFPGGMHSYVKPGTQTGNPIMRGNEMVDQRDYLTDVFAREATSFIDRHSKEPFFLYLAFNALHSPMEATQKYLDRFPHVTDPKRKIFAAMLSAQDDAVGNVLTQLRKSGIEENTLVFFLGDNGGPTKETSSRNDPLRGFKGETLEGGIRVPFLAQWKGKLPAGKVYEKPVIALDIHATAIQAAGIAPPTEKKLDGVDILPYLTGKNTDMPHESLYWRFGKLKAIRQGNMKLVWMSEGPPELYDLAADIGETKNLAAQKPETVKELSQLFDKWNAELIKPLWMGLQH